MNTDNLISLADFAEQAGLSASDVTRLIAPQKIQTEVVGGRKFIDRVKYPPESFKKEEKEKKQ